MSHVFILYEEGRSGQTFLAKAFTEEQARKAVGDRSCVPFAKVERVDELVSEVGDIDMIL